MIDNRILLYKLSVLKHHTFIVKVITEREIFYLHFASEDEKMHGENPKQKKRVVIAGGGGGYPLMALCRFIIS